MPIPITGEPDTVYSRKLTSAGINSTTPEGYSYVGTRTRFPLSQAHCVFPERTTVSIKVFYTENNISPFCLKSQYAFLIKMFCNFKYYMVEYTTYRYNY